MSVSLNFATVPNEPPPFTSGRRHSLPWPSLRSAVLTVDVAELGTPSATLAERATAKLGAAGRRALAGRRARPYRLCRRCGADRGPRRDDHRHAAVRPRARARVRRRSCTPPSSRRRRSSARQPSACRRCHSMPGFAHRERRLAVQEPQRVLVSEHEQANAPTARLAEANHPPAERDSRSAHLVEAVKLERPAEGPCLIRACV